MFARLANGSHDLAVAVAQALIATGSLACADYVRRAVLPSVAMRSGAPCVGRHLAPPSLHCPHVAKLLHPLYTLFPMTQRVSQRGCEFGCGVDGDVKVLLSIGLFRGMLMPRARTCRRDGRVSVGSLCTQLLFNCQTANLAKIDEWERRMEKAVFTRQ